MATSSQTYKTSTSPVGTGGFSLDTIKKALQRIITGYETPGGLIGPKSYLEQLIKSPSTTLLASLASVYEMSGLPKVTPTGEIKIEPKRHLVEAATQEGLYGAGYTFKQSPIQQKTTPTPTPTPAYTGPTITTQRTPTTETPKATITQTTRAPTEQPTPPARTSPQVTVTSPPPATAGYSAPIPSALPPARVMPGEATIQVSPEALARYEAMIRALQELAGGARYVPMPAVGVESFGPAGALERALKRLREREFRV